MESHGKAAERLVAERLRAALPADAFHLYPNAEWLGPMRDGGPPRDGEADLVIVHAEHGILVLEVKSGIPSRDDAGRWWIGGLALDQRPVHAGEGQQAPARPQARRHGGLAAADRAARRPRDRPAGGRPREPAPRPRPPGRGRPARARPRCRGARDAGVDPPLGRGRVRVLARRRVEGRPARRPRRPARRRAPRPDLGAPPSRPRAHRGRPGGAPGDQPRAGAHRQPDAGPCAGSRSSARRAAGSRCSPPRRPVGWRARGTGRSWSASTSASRRASSASSRRRRPRPAST